MRKLSLLLLAICIAAISNAQLTGTKNIPGDYATLAAAITDLNTQGVGAGGVTINLIAGNPETAPAGGYSITTLTGSAANPIVIMGNGNTITAAAAPTAGSRTDALFKIIGGDYITIQNFVMTENPANTTGGAIGVQQMTEFGVALFAASTTDGAQNNTIQNNTITMSSATAYQNAIGIFSTTASSSTNGVQAAASIAGTNSNNKFYGNTISGVAHGFYFISPAQTATVFESGNDIGGTSPATGNTITYGISNTAGDLGFTSYSGTTPAGIYFRNVVGNSARYNTITSVATLTLVNGGIFSANGTAPTGITYTTTISNNNITMTNTGTTAMTGIDFGSGLSTGTIACSSNTIVMNQNATTTVSAPVIGIKANYASAGATVNSNNVTLNQNFTATATVTNSSALTAITVPSGTTGAPTVNVLGNTVTINRATTVSSSFTATMSGAVIGIQATTATTTMNIGATGAGNNNTVTIKEAVGGGAGTTSYTSAVTFIDANAAHATVNVVNNTLNTTGSTIRSTGLLKGVNQDATVTVLVNIRNNTFNVDRVAASGTAYFQFTSGTPSEVADTVSNNSVTFTGLSGTTAVTGISSGGGPTSPVANNKNINNNTISISGTHTGTSIGITCSFTNTGFIKNNSVTITSASPTVTGITTSGTVMTVTGNGLNLSSSTTSPTAMTGVNLSGSGAHAVNTNTFSGMNFTGVITAAPTVSGIALSGGTLANVTNNTITNISVGAATSTGNPVVDGVLISGGSGVNVFKNKIYGLTTGSTGATGVVNGVRISGGGSTNANNVYNNLIGDLTAPAATNSDAIRGISITSTTTTTTHNIYYNTIYLTGGGGTNFGGTGIFHTTSTTATTSTLNLRNNVVVNNLTPNGTGLAVAFRRSSGAASTLANYASTSNNNLFFAGVLGGSASQLIYADGTSTAQTISAYKSGVFTAGTIAPRDQSSVTENPNFLSVSGASSNFLHIDPSIATQIESAASPIAGITDDYDGDTRNITTPDIGADEFDGIAADLSGPSISYTLLGNTTCVTDVTLNPVTITDASGVNTTPGTKPRLYFKKSTDANTYAGNTSADNGWKYVEASNGASPFSFTTNYTLLQSAVVAGDVIQYFVVAQDNAGTPNVGINSGTFAATPSSVALTAGAFPLTGTINSYNITATLPTSITIGAAGTYPTLTGPGGLFAALNAGALSGNTTVTILDAAVAETGANALNAINYACGGGPYTLTIKPATGVTTVLSGSFAGPLINLNGADNVTFDGSNNGTSSKDMTISNTSTSGSVMQFINDATQNTLKNTIILGVNSSSLSGSVVFSTSTGSSGNSNNTIDNNDIRDGATVPVNAIYSLGSVSALNSSNTISNNNIFNWSGSGLLVASGGAGNGWNVSNNNVYQTASRTAALVAISMAGGNNHLISSNKLYQTSGTLSAAYTGISVTGGTNGHNISSNSIGGAAADRSGAALTITSGSSNLNAIALTVGTTTATNVNGNTISNLSINTTSTVSSVFGVNVSGGNVNIGTLEGNIFGGGAAAYDTIRNAYDNGIINNSGAGFVDIQNNLIGNVSYYRASGDRTAGINISAGTTTIKGNIIRDFNVNGTGTAFAFLPVGILLSTTTSGNIVEGNQIYNIRNTNAGTSAYTVAGIVITGNMTATVVRKNNIYNILADGTGTGTSSPRPFGIYNNTASITYSNNMIAVGSTVGLESRVTGIEDAGTGTNNYYFNSVSVTGTTSAGANNSYAFNRSGTATVDIKDNIFSNTRTGGTGFHVAIANTNAAATGWAATASNYNDLYTASPATVGQWLGTGAGNNRTFTGWQASQGAGTPGSGGDANSWNYTPGFTSATNLHIPAATVTPLESGGTPAGSITDDIDNQTRPGPPGSVNGGGTQVDIGADEFDGTPASVMTYVSSTTTQSNVTNVGVGSTNQQVIGIEVVTTGIVNPLTLTDFTLNTNGTTAPLTDITNAKVWYTGTSSTFATSTQFGSTVAAPNGAFVVTGSQVLSSGTNYFWLTYDVPCTATLTNVVDAECNSLTVGAAQVPTVQAPAGTRTIVAGAGLSGTKTIGAAGDYPSLTGAGGLFAAINTNGLSGNLTVNIIDASVTETGATALNAVTYVCGGPYTILIKPSITATLTGSVGTGSLIKLNGADNVTIDGSNSGGTDRSLTIQNTTTTTSGNAVIWMASPASGNGSNNNTIKNCIIEGNSATTTFTGVHIGGNATIGITTAGTELNNNNTISNNLFRKTQYGATLFGFAAASPDQNNVISNNNFGTAVTGEGHSLLAINADRQSGLVVSGNEVQNVVNATTGAAAPFGGIRLLDFKNGLCYNNKVHDLAYTGTNTPKIYGIAMTNATYTTAGSPSNAQIYNNVVYKINSTGTSAVWNMTGILASAGYGDKIYYNSVSLTGQLANSSSGLVAAFANGDGNITSVGTNIEVRNNSFSITGSSAVAGGNFWAYYTQATTLTGSTLNYNDLYCNGTNATNNVGRFNAVNSTTLAAWQTATGQEANSIAADPLYNATNNLVPQIGSPLVAAATPIAGITTDITGFTRSVTTPTIGAYEQASDAAGPAITYTPLSFTCATGDRALNGVTITDVTGVPTTGPLQPRVYYRKNTGTWFSAQGTLASGTGTSGTWDFTISAATMGGLTAGDVVQYYVIAQDVAGVPNISSNPSAGLVATDVNTVTTAPTTPNSFNINNAIGGTYTVGAGGNYTTLTAAIAAYNTSCLNSAVVFELTDATYSTGETFPLQINVNPDASALKTLTIRPAAGVAATVTGSTSAIFKLNGADYVIIDGINTGGSSLTLSNTSTTSGTTVVWMGSLGAGAGATNDTLRNCTVLNGTLGSSTVVNFGVFVGQTSGAANGEDNDNIAITGNTIRNCVIGIQSVGGATAGQQNDNTLIDNNIIGDAVAVNSIGRYGMNVGQSTNATVSRNTIQNVVTSDNAISTSNNATGIIISTGTTGSLVTRNKITGIRYTGTSGYGGKGIDINTGNTASNVAISNNFIADILGDGWSALTSDAIIGIRITGTTGGIKLYYNSVNLGSGSFAGNTSGTQSAALFVNSSVTALDIRDNILVNNLDNTNATTDKSWAINSAAANTAFTTINYNDYSVSGAAGVLGFLSADLLTLGDIQTATGQDVNSISVAPVFVSATDLHLVPASNCALHRKGTPIAGITTDIDGDTRHATYPDMGADEYAINVTGPILWTGAVNTDWFNVGNWNLCELPGPTTDVTINGSLPNYPNVSANVTIKSLTMNSGSSINVATGVIITLLGP